MNFLKKLAHTSRGFLNLIKFIYFIGYEDIFAKGSPKLIFKVLVKYFELEKDNFSQCFKYGRSTQKSCELLKSLVDVYIETSSSTVLKQIFAVIEEEFIKRENKNGRKQFQSR